jgi:ferrochelatase
MSDASSPTGVLLLQLGTPDSTDVSDVRKYLREFLSDPRVLDIPAPARFLLLNGIILPFRPRRSAEAYEKIWTEDGSPLIIHTDALTEKVAARLGDDHRVAFGMRYQSPSIAEALGALVEAGCERLVILPLFPQYASASGGSAVARTLELIGEQWNVLDVATLGAFYDDPGYIAATAAVAQPVLEEFAPDHVLFSYHGLPEKQVRKCYATTRALAAALDLPEDRFSTGFQSRLAGQKWIEPYTDYILPELFERGVRRLAVLTPSFTADCLETLEEIGIRGRDQWLELGGEELQLVPCVNSDDGWADAVAAMVRRTAVSRTVPGSA